MEYAPEKIYDLKLLTGTFDKTVRTVTNDMLAVLNPQPIVIERFELLPDALGILAGYGSTAYYSEDDSILVAEAFGLEELVMHNGEYIPSGEYYIAPFEDNGQVVDESGIEFGEKINLG